MNSWLSVLSKDYPGTIEVTEPSRRYIRDTNLLSVSVKLVLYTVSTRKRLRIWSLRVSSNSSQSSKRSKPGKSWPSVGSHRLGSLWRLVTSLSSLFSCYSRSSSSTFISSSALHDSCFLSASSDEITKSALRLLVLKNPPPFFLILVYLDIIYNAFK